MGKKAAHGRSRQNKVRLRFNMWQIKTNIGVEKRNSRRCRKLRELEASEPYCGLAPGLSEWRGLRQLHKIVMDQCSPYRSGVAQNCSCSAQGHGFRLGDGLESSQFRRRAGRSPGKGRGSGVRWSPKSWYRPRASFPILCRNNQIK